MLTYGLGISASPPICNGPFGMLACTFGRALGKLLLLRTDPVPIPRLPTGSYSPISPRELKSNPAHTAPANDTSLAGEFLPGNVTACSLRVRLVDKSAVCLIQAQGGSDSSRANWSLNSIKLVFLPGG